MEGSSRHEVTLIQNLISDSMDQILIPTKSSVMGLKEERNKSKSSSQIITNPCIASSQPEASINFVEKVVILREASGQ